MRHRVSSLLGRLSAVVLTAMPTTTRASVRDFCYYLLNRGNWSSAFRPKARGDAILVTLERESKHSLRTFFVSSDLGEAGPLVTVPLCRGSSSRARTKRKGVGSLFSRRAVRRRLNCGHATTSTLQHRRLRLPRPQPGRRRAAALPKSPFGLAVQYALHPWDALLQYTHCRLLALDNNPA